MPGGPRRKALLSSPRQIWEPNLKSLLAIPQDQHVPTDFFSEAQHSEPALSPKWLEPTWLDPKNLEPNWLEPKSKWLDPKMFWKNGLSKKLLEPNWDPEKMA